MLRLTMVMLLLLATASVQRQAIAHAQNANAPAKGTAAAKDNEHAGVDAHGANEGEGDLLIEATGSDMVEAHILTHVGLTPEGKGYAVIPAPTRISFAPAQFTLLAGSTVIWVTPADPVAAQRQNFFQLIESNFGGIEIYAEHDVWMRYGEDGTTFRADHAWFDLRQGEAGFFSVRANVDQLRAHTNARTVKQASGASDVTGEAGGVSLVGHSVEAAPTGELRGTSTVNIDAAFGTVVRRERDPDAFALEQGERLFFRAERMRIYEMSSTEDGRTLLQLDAGVVSTNSLADPSLNFKARRVVIDLRPQRRILVLDRPSLALFDTTILPIPVDDFVYDLDAELPRVRFDVSDTGAFGASLRTQIDLITGYDFFFDPQPEFRPFRFSPIYDHFEKRGTGYGAEIEFRRQPIGSGEWFARLQGYRIKDRGDQRASVRDLGYYPLHTPNRGRVTGYGRVAFPRAFQVDAALNYQSDRTFIEEFFHAEHRSNNPQQSFIRVSRRLETQAFFLDTRLRARGFMDEVERVPMLGFSAFREPVGPRQAGLLMGVDAQLGIFRIRRAESGDRLDMRDVLRADVDMRLSRPFDFGLFSLEPMVGLATTAADTGVDGNGTNNPLYDPGLGYRATLAGVDEELVTRTHVLAGAVLTSHLVRVFPEAKFAWFALHGLRHVVTPQVRWEQVLGPRGRSHRFLQLDEVDAREPYQRMVLSLRNRLQARREGRTFDWVDLLIEAPLYPAPAMDNGGRRFGDIEGLLSMDIRQQVAVRAGAFFDPHNFDLRRSHFSVLSSLFGLNWAGYYRGLRGEHQIVGTSIHAALSTNYSIAVGQEYDALHGDFRDTLVRLTRTVVDGIALDISYRRDAVTHDSGISLNLSTQFGP